MTVRVTAATKNGSTREIAQLIAEAPTDRGVPAVVFPPDEVDDLVGYEAVVPGSAVYSGHWLPTALALVDRAPARGPAGRCGCSPVAPVGDPASSLTQKMGVDPMGLPKIHAATGAREHPMFGAKLDGTMLPFAQRMALSLFRGVRGDFRDWNAIHAWAAGIADALHQTSTC